MDIVGGLYIELCCMPKWDHAFGSGGRAAAALSNLMPGLTLHTYGSLQNSKIEKFNEEFDINIKLYPRNSEIAFSYFHPLSNPHIQPRLGEITKERSMHVQADLVLQFGFVEGDAIVNARKAVFDPQTWRKRPSFRSNGSTADELAIVLNEEELLSLNPSENVTINAMQLIAEENAKVIVVKKGPRGAEVFESNGCSNYVPLYKSSRVFKIGTGDIFSAFFAYYWAVQELDPKEAAYLASKSVAAYCNYPVLPLNFENISEFEPLNFNCNGTILLLGKANTLGNRFVLEEARFVLLSMGVKVICPELNDQNDGSATSILIIADTYSIDIEKKISPFLGSTPIIMLKQDKDNRIAEIIDLSDISITDDFTTAIYKSVWASFEL